jgi:SpoVK/Ycf46/Vps4 family AAA+-type ATPase
MHTKGVVILYHEESGNQGRDNIEAHFYWIGKQPQQFANVYTRLSEFYSDKAKKNPNINVLISTPSGFQIQTAGEVNHKFEPSHYLPNTVKMFDNICESIKKKNFDKGRLWLMHGKPGTGKTYLIRGLITEVGRDATFLMIPPDLILQVGSPNMVPVFLNHASNNNGNPLVIILEDADNALVPRQGDNMSFIQSLLNLTAGILGDALNVAILATTNVDKMSVEPALLRSGRMAESAHFDALPVDKAREIFHQLLLKKNPEDNKDELMDTVENKIQVPTTLSDIYALVYETKGPSEEELKFLGNKSTKKVGF